MIPKITNRLIDKELKKAQSASMIVGMVTRDGKQVESYLHDYYQGVDPENLIFEIGSATKTFTTTLLAKLVTVGVVSLDDSVCPYVPAFKKALTYQGEEVTFRHLATHTASLPKDDIRTIRRQMKQDPSLKLNPFQQYDEAAFQTFFKNYQPKRPFGTKWSYSNLGMALLGYVLAKITDSTYEDAIDTYILTPLGMKDTYFTVPNDDMHRYIKAYTKKEEQIPPMEIHGVNPAGGLKSTMHDMLNYLQFQMGLKDTALADSMALTHENQHIRAMKGFDSGLGWMMDRVKWTKYPIIQHGGTTIGFHTYCGFIKELGIGVVAISTIQLNLARMFRILLKQDGLINTNIANSIFTYHIEQMK